MSFDLTNTLIHVFDDLFSLLKIDHKFMCEVNESTLNSSETVNILVGISGDISGNIMFGYDEKIAKEVAAKIIGVKKIDKLDKYSKAALADFYSEFCKRLIHTIRLENFFNIGEDVKDYAILSSNPTYISGEDMFAMIGKIDSKKLFFKVNGGKFGIAYGLEAK